MEKIFIPLGNDCSISYQLQKLGLRKITLPFDWIKSDIKGIVKCLEDNFKYFLEFDLFEIKNISDNFSYVEDDFNESVINQMLRVYNVKYKFHFLHDFINDSSYDISKQFTDFRIKYSRRIEKFNMIMEDTTINKIFIHIGPTGDLVYLEKLKLLLEKKGYSNFTIKFIDYKVFETIGTSSWKREEFNWMDFFIDDIVLL